MGSAAVARRVDDRVATRFLAATMGDPSAAADGCCLFGGMAAVMNFRRLVVVVVVVVAVVVVSGNACVERRGWSKR